METLTQNAFSGTKCHHHKTLDKPVTVGGSPLVHRICTRCKDVVGFSADGKVFFPRPVGHLSHVVPEDVIAGHEPIEDEQAPGYWDCSPDLAHVSGFQSFRHLAWSVIGFAIFIALATLGVLRDFN